MKKLLLIAFIFSALPAAVFVYAKISAKADDFKPAEDFPREALIYVQIRDLPALIKLWNDSELRRKYMESANFKDFERNHLALKLAERAAEIEFGLGIFPDLGFASGLSEQGAAFAVYDIGKMELVFIAPMSEAKILASGLFQIQTGFEEIQIDEETTVYSKEIDVDQARQRQKVLFTNFRGRLIVATSEKYFLRTLENIKGQGTKNRLSAEPLFKRTAEKTKPNLATVWLNQEKLNDDWYFRRYWLMTETERLKSLRAAMFDFEMQDKKIVERRVFFTTENKSSAAIKTETVRRLAGLIPSSAQFYRIEPAGTINADETITDVLFDLAQYSSRTKPAKSRKDYYFRDWEKSYSYSYLDDDFSEQVDDTADGKAALPETAARKTGGDLAKLINAANPQAMVSLFSPRSLAPPLFFENRKALIIALQNPSDLSAKMLENELSRAAQSSLTAGNQNDGFGWTDASIGGFTVREMVIPSLGWKILYARRGNELILAGSEDFLKDILEAGKQRAEIAGTFEKLTVINLKSGRESFDHVFKTIEADEKNSGYPISAGFFVENIGSLLDAVSDVEKIEIRQSSAPNYLFEELDFLLREKN